MAVRNRSASTQQFKNSAGKPTGIAGGRAKTSGAASSMSSVKSNFAAGQASTASKSSSGGKATSTGKRTGGLGQPGGTTPSAAAEATVAVVKGRGRGIGTSAERSAVVGASLSQKARTSPLASTIQYLEDRHGPLDMSSPSAPSRRAIEWMESRSNVETSPSVVASRRASEVAQIQQRSDRIYNDMVERKAEALGLPATPDTGAIEEKVPDPGRVVVPNPETLIGDPNVIREGESRGRIRSENSVPPAIKPQVESSTEPLWEPHVGITETWGGEYRGPVAGTSKTNVGKGAITHDVQYNLDGDIKVAGQAGQSKPWSEADQLSVDRKVYEDEEKR